MKQVFIKVLMFDESGPDDIENVLSDVKIDKMVYDACVWWVK